jgi:hypothetical protein
VGEAIGTADKILVTPLVLLLAGGCPGPHMSEDKDYPAYAGPPPRS